MTRKIAIDAGHGMYTAGKRCKKELDIQETREWELNRRIVERLQYMAQTYDVEMLRLDDPSGKRDVPVGERRDSANAFGAEIVISVHHNAGVGGGKGGGTVVFSDPANIVTDQVMKSMYDSVTGYTGLLGNRSKKISRKSLAVCRTACPALLLENGFMDSATDVPIILSQEHAQKTAQGIFRFLIDYLQITKKETSVPQQATESAACYIGQVMSKTGLNLRQTSGNGGTIVKSLPNQSYVLVLTKRSDGWWKVKAEDGTPGYVFSSYLDILRESDFPRRVVIDNTGLNIRSGAGMSFPVLQTMPYGADYMVLRTQGTWALVWCGESIGWSSASDLYSVSRRSVSRS